MVKRSLLLMTGLALSACGGGSANPPLQVPAPVAERAPNGTIDVLHGAAIGFSVNTPERAAIAAREGVTTTILYDGAPGRGTPLERALMSHHIAAIDGGVSNLLYRWECYRTLTIKPPPKSYTWCAGSYAPIRTTAELLRKLDALLEADARKPYVAGYWVLDDWPYWDAGSAHAVLPQMHAEIEKITPGLPAICGFGAAVGPPGTHWWDPGLAKNYSSAGCDAVGWYNYSPFGRKKPSNGRNLDWSMHALLPAMAKSLARYGWSEKVSPLIGIGQAWSGSFGNGDYQPGLSAGQMKKQASAFCSFGGTSISWYAWDDSGYNPKTQTPGNSKAIANGIEAGLAACRGIWSQTR